VSARHNRPAPCADCVRVWDWSGLRCRRSHEVWERRLDRDYWADRAGSWTVPAWCLAASKLRGRRQTRTRR